MAFSSIEWTEYTWNPVTGCTKVSEGCRNCYAERFAKRLQAMGNERYKDGFQVRLHPDLLTQPLSWKRPRVVFVNSMSDLFHEEVPYDFIARAFDIMGRCPQHTFQILTKRSQRLAEIADYLHWTHNIWMGVSVENSSVISRVHDLCKIKARVKFISCEPLIAPIRHLPLNGIDWVIVGGESGPGARPMKREWVLAIRDQCIRKSVPFFFKQWGGTRKKAAGRILNGRTWDERPPLANEELSNKEVLALNR